MRDEFTADGAPRPEVKVIGTADLAKNAGRETGRRTAAVR
jgi:hypothetical protein